jgi:transcriptional regulator with XRE-family HTH domain
MLSEEAVNTYAARQVRELRKTMGLSQTKLAREMNLSPQQVQKYEWGINRMSVGKALQFAEAFDVSINIFFPDRNKHYSSDSVPPPTMRFIRLIAKIDPKHYDQVYIALKAIEKLSRRNQ